MVFCRGCGKEIHESAITCPHCGAPQGRSSTSNNDKAVPDGIKGWSWGAFLLNWIWAIGNKTWIGLLAIIPYVGFIMAIVLGFKGREWAWKNKEWESIEHFNSVQKKWSFWGVIIVVIAMVIGILAAIAIPAYKDYSERAKQVAENQTNTESMTPDQIPQATKADSSPAQTEMKQEESISNNGLYQWGTGWGQGVTEYSAEDGNGNRLYIGCSSERAVSAIATIGGEDFYSDDTGFDMVVDGETYSNPFQTDCRACSDNFPYFWAALRKANNIKVSAAGKSAVIPSNGIGNVLPEFSSPDNACQLGFML